MTLSVQGFWKMNFLSQLRLVSDDIL